jgi:hypothetical protein
VDERSNGPARKRSSGMAALGVLHIVVGAVGFLFSCAMLLTIIVLLLPSHYVLLQLPTAVMHEKARLFFALFLALLHALASILLIVAGVRVLDVSPSGRKLSMVAAFLWTFICIIEYFASDFFTQRWSIVVFLVLNAYPITIELLFLRTDWREAFSKQPA